jgi:hypothetical protein
LTAFGIGKYSTLDTLKKLDPDAVILTNIDQLSSVFGGFDSRYTIEPLMENVPVYLDVNNNGIVDPSEPKQLTKKDDTESILGKTNYQFTFDNLAPGTYKVRTVAPDGYAQTAPSTSVFTDTVTAAGETFTHLFGVHKGSQEPPNSDPTFLTLAPTTKLKAGESLVYRALASDPDADEVTYSLVLNPQGMSVDPKNGSVVWTPTVAQVEEYYTQLQATRDRANCDRSPRLRTLYSEVQCRLAGNGRQGRSSFAVHRGGTHTAQQSSSLHFDRTVQPATSSWQAVRVPRGSR